MKKAEFIDLTGLTRKYACNVAAVARAWQRGSSDAEVARGLCINPDTLQSLRNDLIRARQRERASYLMQK